MKVYILSTYEEHGANDVRATLDPSKLVSMLDEYGDVTDAMLYELRKAPSSLFLLAGHHEKS